MQSFLSEVTKSLYERYGDDISSLTLILPSRRAGLFFCDALAAIALRPLWQPSIKSVGELMEEVAGIKATDPIRLITELYQVYSRYHDESFDAFYFWGEILLSDFNQIDKYLVGTDTLFANISELHELESSDYLTEEQRKVISRFWGTFRDGTDSDEKKKFISVWNTLGAIYSDFNRELSSKGLAYEGMVQRMAAEKIAGSGPLPGMGGSRYIIIGFNALTECEKKLFGWLQKSGKAEFCWDYDDYYVDNPDNEAGLFLRENIRMFPTPHCEEITHHNFAEDKNITVISSPSDSLQCKYAHTFLRSLIDRGKIPGKETAIVLTDETLLIPLLHSIPDEVENINVTMGYPLRQTTAYSFVERLLSLQSRAKVSRSGSVVFYHGDATGLLNHPYLREYDEGESERMIADTIRSQKTYVPPDMLSQYPLAAMVFTAACSREDISEYLRRILSVIGNREALGESTARRREIFSLIIETVDKLENSIGQSSIEISFKTFIALLRRMLQGMNIPFVGEPLQGIQIMGILETRNLDFENVLILSADDDNFPGNRATSPSFVPFNLRYGYGLPTPQHHEGVYAYYFYRLAQRCPNLHIAYCSISDDKHTGEPGRYIYQLEYESPHKINKVNIPLRINLDGSAEAITVEKSGETAEKLRKYLSGGGMRLSPTAIYSFIECPLKFYFRHIARIVPEEEIAEEIDLPMFGTILHKSMELLYSPLAGDPDPQEKIRKMTDRGNVETYVEKALLSEYLRDDKATGEDLTGEMILVKEIVSNYIQGGILPYDAAQQRFIINALEERVECEFAGVSLRGIADRIDVLSDGSLRVVDYKTGSRNTSFASVGSLFSEKSAERSAAVFQIFLYCLMLGKVRSIETQPALYHVRYMNAPDFSPLAVHGKNPVSHFSSYAEEFGEYLKKTFAGLFDLSAPFSQCTDEVACKYCDFKSICRRG